MATPTRAVLDASVVVRATVGGSLEARRWLEEAEDGRVIAFVPDLLFAEVANSLTRYVRAGVLNRSWANALLAAVESLRLESTPARSLFRVAHAVAIEKSLTAYDAHYLVLAEAEDAVLVTADHTLAAAASQSVLLE